MKPSFRANKAGFGESQPAVLRVRNGCALYASDTRVVAVTMGRSASSSVPYPPAAKQPVNAAATVRGCGSWVLASSARASVTQTSHSISVDQNLLRWFSRRRSHARRMRPRFGMYANCVPFSIDRRFERPQARLAGRTGISKWAGWPASTACSRRAGRIGCKSMIHANRWNSCVPGILQAGPRLDASWPTVCSHRTNPQKRKPTRARPRDAGSKVQTVIVLVSVSLQKC